MKSFKDSKSHPGNTNLQVIEAFKRRSIDHGRIVSKIQEVTGKDEVEEGDLVSIEPKTIAKACKLSIKRAEDIISEFTTALKKGIATRRRVYVPEYSRSEFDEIFERFCGRSEKHRLVAETALHNPDASTIDKEVLNKSKLAEITGLSPKDIDEILAELRTTFSDFG